MVMLPVFRKENIMHCLFLFLISKFELLTYIQDEDELSPSILADSFGINMAFVTLAIVKNMREQPSLCHP